MCDTGWGITEGGLLNFTQYCEIMANNSTHMTPAPLIERVVKGCNLNFSRKKKLSGRYSSIYWWINDIAQKRNKCVSERRRLIHIIVYFFL